TATTMQGSQRCTEYTTCSHLSVSLLCFPLRYCFSFLLTSQHRFVIASMRNGSLGSNRIGRDPNAMSRPTSAGKVKRKNCPFPLPGFRENSGPLIAIRGSKKAGKRKKERNRNEPTTEQ